MMSRRASPADLRRHLPEPFYSTDRGAAYIGDALELVKYFPDRCVNLILTSPPFALTRKKEYGNFSSDEYVEWFLRFAKEFQRILTEDGSFVLDLGGAYLPGHPVRTICTAPLKFGQVVSCF
jgi:site-specific DNA-methyltransferase (cytosine-N4-specific)